MPAQPGGFEFRSAGRALLDINLRQQARDVLPQSAERIGVEPIRFPFRGAEEISDGRSTKVIQETKDPALLNREGEAPVQNGLRPGVVADRDANRNALALKGPVQ